MTTERQRAFAEFKRIIKWIVVIAILMVAGALVYTLADARRARRRAAP